MHDLPPSGPRLRAAWVYFLGRHPWSITATLTFGKNRRSVACGQLPERADRAFRRLVRVINERLYGTRWMSKSRTKGVVWARVHEFQADGTSHFHALFYTPDAHPDPELMRLLKDLWDRWYGFSRVEHVHSPAAAREYLVKHVADDSKAELDLSINFGRFD